MKKLLLLAIATLGLGACATPKAEAGVFIGVGFPVVSVYSAFYPYPYYYGYPYPYGYCRHPAYARVYNGRVVGHSAHNTPRTYTNDK